MQESILEVRNLSSEYYLHGERIKILKDISFNLKKNGSLAVVGESGSGKTTIAYSIMRLIMPYEGKITTGEILYSTKEKKLDILKLTEEELRELRGKEISIILQDSNASLNPVLKVSRQLKEAIHQKLPAKELNEIALRSLEKVKLPSRIYDLYPHQLSGGQRQRVAIALSLINNPAILIADEPTTGLDATVAKEIIELLFDLKDRLSIILITHDLRVAFAFCEEVIVMYAGEIFEKATTKSIIEVPKHPYTKGLIEAMPDIKQIKKPLKPLPGNPPDFKKLSNGCYFAHRCMFKMEICQKSHPEIYKSDDSYVRCFLYKI